MPLDTKGLIGLNKPAIRGSTAINERNIAPRWLAATGGKAHCRRSFASGDQRSPRSLANAPIDDAPTSAEEMRAVEASREWLKDHEPISHEQVLAEFALALEEAATVLRRRPNPSLANKRTESLGLGSAVRVAPSPPEYSEKFAPGLSLVQLEVSFLP
jgi:hypothetical protein